MNTALWAEMERMKEIQEQLRDAVDLLGRRIEALSKRITENEAGERTVAESAPMAVPPVLEKAVGGNVESGNTPQMTLQRTQPAPEATPRQSAANSAREKMAAITRDAAAPVPPVPPVVPPPATPSASAKPESFEMRLGSYWLVRIGIVAMLTALVFFGNYAYQSFIVNLGPVGKVTLLYLASGALLGFGAWFQRRAAKESLRNYAQVLFAGGTAAVYFTTYAAHHFPNLLIINSALLDGALLLGWAGFMAWLADRKKSEVFAMFAVGLAYYTSVITRVGHFTLYSNLVLAAATLFFLVRNRWTTLSFGSLIATYASYGFWRFYSGEGWHWAGVEAGLWTGVYFLGLYWAVFTAAVFLSRHKEFSGVNRATFATLNNAAFFVMFLLTMLQVHSGGFWRFCLCFGTVLLGASALAKVRLPDEPVAANNYLAQGLLLVTAGIIAKFSDDQSTLALVLAMESAVLWMLGTMRRNIITRTGACVSAALSAIWALDGIDRNVASGVWLGAGVGALLAFNAFWAHWREQRNSPRLFRVTPTYFSALALLLWTVTVWQNVASVNRPAAFALMAGGLVGSVYVTRLRELGMLSQLLMPVAIAEFALNQYHPAPTEPWWAFAALGGVALALVHWWERHTCFDCDNQLRRGGQFIMALILVGATACWLEPQLSESHWVLAVSGLLIAFTAYGGVTRNRVIALVGQVFAGIAVVGFMTHAGSYVLPWLPGLAPLGALTALALAGRRWADSYPSESAASRWVKQHALWYGRLVMALVVWWTFAYVQEAELAWSFTALGAAAFAIAGWRQSQDFLAFSATLNLCALGALDLELLKGTGIYWPNLAAVIVWMAEQQIARRSHERFRLPELVHHSVIVLAGLTLWWLLSRWVTHDASGFYLTASWSVFAFVVFTAGVLLRERMYRWLGLGVLGAALARVVIFDVWRLETIYRILSFFALGLVLLVLGFIYNKYQERLRQWL